MTAFIRRALEGYEPVAVRAFLVAVATLAAAFGIGTGDLPVEVDAVLTFLTFALPVLGGLWARSKVSPVERPAEDAPDVAPEDSAYLDDVPPADADDLDERP